MKQVAIKDYLRESRLFQNRALAAAFTVVILQALLIIRLADLQLIRHQHFTTLSLENRVKVEPLPPTRGLIYDRNGDILAQNLPAHSLEITPELVDDMDRTLSGLGQLIEINDKDIGRFNQLRQQRRRFDKIPIRVHLDEAEVARFAINRHLFPGVDIQAKLLRNYPQAEIMAHVLGYVGRISEKDLQEIDQSAYAGTTYIGKTGVEKSYESQLHGQVGMQRVEVNALGRVIRVLENRPPIPGENLYLAVDSRLQRVATDAFEEENGAAVAIDPGSGGILAMVSKPGFDPNLFVEGISPSDYDALQASEDKPLFNRALRGQYPPGSTVKPFMGLAGLESGVLDLSYKKNCSGFYRLPKKSHKYRDWKKQGHGPVRLRKAIIQSCDVFFYDLAHQLGVDRIHSYLSRFGFGAHTDIDITGELPGVLPSRHWKRVRKNAPWYPGETLILGTGQGYFLTTPLQLANATATLASGGMRIRPQVVAASSENSASNPVSLISKPTKEVPKQSIKNWDAIISAMTQVVEGERGTARGIRTEKFRIAGKTGTAQVFTVKQDEKYDEETVEKKMRDHALFIAFAPMEHPKIAVAVLVENGGHGGTVAAPIARKIMDFHLLPKNNIEPE